MSTFNFNDQEKEFILKAIAKRRADCQDEFYKKHLVELDKIEGELKFDLSNLTPRNKSIIIGCLRETYIYPNKKLLNLSEFQMMFRVEELRLKMEDLDIAMNLLNKLLKKSEQKYRLFADSLKKLNGMLNSNQILYSSTTDGKVYKAGMLVDRENGVRFELDGWSEPTNFEIGRLHSQYYLRKGTPSEVRHLLKDYSDNHELTEMQKSFDKILERVCGYKR